MPISTGLSRSNRTWKLWFVIWSLMNMDRAIDCDGNGGFIGQVDLLIHVYYWVAKLLSVLGGVVTVK